MEDANFIQKEIEKNIDMDKDKKNLETIKSNIFQGVESILDNRIIDKLNNYHASKFEFPDNQISGSINNNDDMMIPKEFDSFKVQYKESNLSEQNKENKFASNNQIFENKEQEEKNEIQFENTQISGNSGIFLTKENQNLVKNNILVYEKIPEEKNFEEIQVSENDKTLLTNNRDLDSAIHKIHFENPLQIPKKPFDDFQLIENDDFNKSISSFQNVSYKATSSNEKSTGSQPIITLNANNIIQDENYFSNTDPNNTHSNKPDFKLNVYEKSNIENSIENKKFDFDFYIVDKESILQDTKNRGVWFEKEENEKREKKIKEKIEYEYQKKVLLRQKALAFIENYQK